MKDRISKVGFKEGAVIIKTTRINPGADEKRTEHKSYRIPHEDFFVAFAALEQHVRDLLELPSSVWKDRIKITGVSWSLSEGTDVEGAVITGQAALEGSDAPLCFNTPHLAFEQYSEGGQAKLMPEEAVEALEELRREAAEFLDGKRAPNAQNEMFPDDEATVVSGKDAAAGEGRDVALADKIQGVGEAHFMPQSVIDDTKGEYGVRGKGRGRKPVSYEDLGIDAAAGERSEPETTISINGGPQIPASTVKRALRLVKADADEAKP